MVILLFGISNVGKTLTGEKLAGRLGYSFRDLDEEIKRRLNTTLEGFMRSYPYTYERCKIKGRILSDSVGECNDDIVIAVSPIYYARNFNPLLDLEQVIAIELQDTEEHIFQRLVFSDSEDNMYKDDIYKNLHKGHYIKEIHGDIVYARRLFKKIKNKYFMDNQSVDQVVAGLIAMVKNISASI